jgi:hypothetical protein
MKYDIWVSDRLRALKPILQRWVDLNVQYAEDNNWKDCPWWYNERASVGILAAAIWQRGTHALEEYSTKKVYDEEPYRGRGDLYFRIRSKGFISESKFCFLKLGRVSKSASARISNLLLSARQSVRDVDGTRTFKRLGLTFVALRIPDCEDEDLSHYIQKARAVLDDVDCEAMAWVLPEEGRRLWSKSGEKWYRYPGTALLIRSRSIR